MALSYPLKRSNYNYKQSNTDGLDPNQLGGSDFNDYMPNVELNSDIITY